MANTAQAPSNAPVVAATAPAAPATTMPAGWYTVAWAGGGKWANSALWAWHYATPLGGPGCAAVTKPRQQYYLGGPVPAGAKVCRNCATRAQLQAATAPATGPALVAALMATK